MRLKNKIKSRDWSNTTRRRFLLLSGAACLALPSHLRAEILTKGSFGGREAYLKRVQGLSGALGAVPRTDPSKRAELRAIATTLSAAVQDLLFNEAQARGGKVAPPASALRAPDSTGSVAVGNGDAVPLSEVPNDWLLLQGGAVQDDVADLVALLEDEGEALSSPAIQALVGSITSAVAAIDRPGS
ncbi:hypothetical protein EOI86_08050 [Hwanghaeella grinnelliae]|uniref:Uncharacterized protein n=1 Tax=Hwanghaeella grinnelliae TaxID=2500179 RepID=A0A437QXJ1_9PROT|nr:hypothetical protein [Hwanghaeella grinnelliae]RVU39189.1 hypothetical protein EOI86_08050 [Hwanghaeella grinnelliae]